MVAVLAGGHGQLREEAGVDLWSCKGGGKVFGITDKCGSVVSRISSHVDVSDDVLKVGVDGFDGGTEFLNRGAISSFDCDVHGGGGWVLVGGKIGETRGKGRKDGKENGAKRHKVPFLLLSLVGYKGGAFLVVHRIRK